MSPDQETVVMTRIFDAPRSRVFEAWTRAEHLEKWFGPAGFEVTDCECDPRPGGVFRMCLRSPRGDAFWVRGSYREVVAPERILIACTADDAAGVPRLEELIEARFEEHGSRTRLLLNTTARGPGAEAARMLRGMQRGWAQTVERLGSLLIPHLRREKEM